MAGDTVKLGAKLFESTLRTETIQTQNCRSIR